MFFHTVVAVAAVLSPVQTEQLVGRWEGALTLPDQSLIPVVLRVSRNADGTIKALADDPSNGAVDVPVLNLKLENGRVSFEVTEVAGHAEAQLSGDTIIGTWISAQGSLPLSLKRVPA